MKKSKKKGTPEILDSVCKLLEECDDFSEEPLKEEVRGWIKAQEIGFGKVMQPLRTALAGDLKGPDLFLIMSMLGKEESIERIKALKSECVSL